jgi:hypothetical protein
MFARSEPYLSERMQRALDGWVRCRSGVLVDLGGVAAYLSWLSLRKTKSESSKWLVGIFGYHCQR